MNQINDPIVASSTPSNLFERLHGAVARFSTIASSRPLTRFERVQAALLGFAFRLLSELTWQQHKLVSLTRPCWPAPTRPLTLRERIVLSQGYARVRWTLVRAWRRLRAPGEMN